MRTFADKTGRSWTFSVNAWTLKSVRDLAGLDLLKLDGPDGSLMRLMADPVLLVDCLYVVCRAEAQAAGVSDEDFGRSMAGDAIDAATKAFLEELADFIPSPRDRARAKRILAATDQVIEATQGLLDAAADRAIEAAATAGSSSSSSPASAASSPGA
ncbi:MAG TPA: hypothetical protein VMW52_11890 [Phycisphaerae bacterium]|nr:hypothetical protein [Phycisphaerae bacterium]